MPLQTLVMTPAFFYFILFFNVCTFTKKDILRFVHTVEVNGHQNCLVKHILNILFCALQSLMQVWKNVRVSK